jgi:hypothetical protein
MHKFIPQILAAGALACASGAHGGTLTESFGAPFEGWESRWFGTESNATNYYVSEYGSDPSYQGASDVSGLWVSDGDSYRDGGDYATVNIRFDADFASALTSFTFDVATALPNTALVFFDAAGAQIAAFTVPDSPLSPYYTPVGYHQYSVTSTTGIGGFSFLGYAQGNVIIDNLVAVTADAAVPEPATWAMLVAGFGAVGFAMRRSRALRPAQAV